MSLLIAVCSCIAVLNSDVTVDDSDEGGFFYNEEEAMNGIGADGQAAMLDHLDSLLDDTDAHDLEEVRGQDGRQHSVKLAPKS